MKKSMEVALALMLLSLLGIGCGYESGLIDAECIGDAQCPDGAVCDDGYCVPEPELECTGDEIECDEVCVNIVSDPDHCGGCGEACSDGETCRSGICEPEVEDCGDLKWCDEKCVDTDSDEEHCGECGNSCDSGEFCDGGQCVECDVAQPQWEMCLDQCINVHTDPDHCGECDEACEAHVGIDHAEPVCEDGHCDWQCVEGYDECEDGSCTDLSTLDDCGSCGTDCTQDFDVEGAQPSCVDDGDGGFECGFECQVEQGFEACTDSGCTDVMNDPEHCGGCDHGCADGEVCAEGDCVPCDPAATPFGGGDGTDDSPFAICSVAHLESIDSQGEHGAWFALYADLDVSGEDGLSSPIGWHQDGSNWSRYEFTGHFDGRGHEVSGLSVTAISWSYLGLFSEVMEGGEVENLVLRDVDVQGRGGVGAVVGRLEGTITDVKVEGGVVGGDSLVGGLVGRVGGSAQIIDGVVTGGVTISGEDSVGGMVGQLEGGSRITEGRVDDVEVTGSGDGVGGMVGYGYSNSVTATATVGPDVTVNGRDQVGGLIGRSNGLVESSQVESIDVSGRDRVGGLVGYASNEYSGAAGQITNSHATGVVGGREDVGGLVGWSRGETRDSSAGVVVTGSQDYVGGLVGYVSGSGSVVDSEAHGDVSGDEDVGGLVGRNDGHVRRSHATGDVTGQGRRVGGLIGELRHLVEQSFATGDVNSNDRHVGGAVGRIHATGEVRDCYATGDVHGTSRVGGLVGVNGAQGQTGTTGDIYTSYSTGYVSGSGTHLGGLVGNNAGDVYDSYWNTSTSIDSSSGGTGLSGTEFMDLGNFEGFDFVEDGGDAWQMGSERPLLWWE